MGKRPQDRGYDIQDIPGRWGAGRQGLHMAGVRGGMVF